MIETTMIASLLELDRQDIRALKITDPYSMHRVVYSLYNDKRSSEEKHNSVRSGILYAEKGGNRLSRKVLLLADREPAQKIQGQYGNIQSKVVPNDFLNFERYRFQVVINPTRRDSRSRRLVPVKGRKSIASWFSERSERAWGFSVDTLSLQVGKIEILQFKAKHQQPITICRASIQGIITVQDRTLFQKSFCQGIGRGRSFGCGLLEITPL